MGAHAVLVAVVVAAGAHHRQGVAVVSRPPTVQQFAHTLAKVARQEGVQQRVQTGVHVRDEESRHGQQSAEVRRVIVIRAPVSPENARLLGQVAHGEHHHHRDQHSGKQRRDVGGWLPFSGRHSDGLRDADMSLIVG